MSIETLVELSRFYGSDPAYILAGGGNTSWKDEDTLYVKGSGFSLAEASPASFVKMDRKSLARIWEKAYPPSNEEREREVLSDMMAAKKEGEEKKRPSVEALLHDIMPFSFVVHLHPALVNGLCCSQKGEASAREIFGEEALWIPSTNPGYILSRLVKDEMAAYYQKHRKNTSIILLQNHGVFVGADTKEGIGAIYDDIMSKIKRMIKREPDFSDEMRTADGGSSENLVNEIIKTLSELAGFSAFMQSGETASFIKSSESFYPVSSAFTPDHIVYAGSDPLFTEASTAAAVSDEWNERARKTGRNPKIVAVRNLGVFSAAATEKAADFALDLFKDSVKVALYTESFGGPLFMTADKIDFINNWEVERFRSSVST